MEKRLGRLETLWSVSAQAVSEASYSIEAALKWPAWDDPAVWAQRIRTNHPLEEAGLTKAIEVALTRCGIPRGEAWMLARLGLERLLAIAASDEKESA
jgi:hypothetical protein